MSDRLFFRKINYKKLTRLYEYPHMIFLHLYFVAINQKLPYVLYSILCRIHNRKFSNWNVKCGDIWLTNLMYIIIWLIIEFAYLILR